MNQIIERTCISALLFDTDFMSIHATIAFVFKESDF